MLSANDINMIPLPHIFLYLLYPDNNIWIIAILKLSLWNTSFPPSIYLIKDEQPKYY